jgi:hypothetical protein
VKLRLTQPQVELEAWAELGNIFSALDLKRKLTFFLNLLGYLVLIEIDIFSHLGLSGG